MFLGIGDVYLKKKSCIKYALYTKLHGSVQIHEFLWIELTWNWLSDQEVDFYWPLRSLLPSFPSHCRCSLDMQTCRSFACFMLYVNRTVFVYSCGFFHAALLVQFIYVITCCRLFSLCCIVFTFWIYRNSSVSAVDESLSSSWFEAAVKRATRVHLRTCLGRHMGSFLLGVCLGRIAVSGVCRCPAF